MVSGQSKPKRNHHVLPELYLKGFVIKNDEPFIWIYKRGEAYNSGQGKFSNNPYRKSVGEMYVKDYYAYPKKDGNKDFDTYENVLESLEKPANIILDKIRSHAKITDKEKYDFTVYIVQMFRRVPSYREKVKKLLPMTGKDYTPTHPEIFTIETPTGRRQMTLAEIRQKAGEIVWEPDLDIQCQLNSFTTAQESILIDKLFSMKWQFFIAPEGQAFLTGDDPIYFPQKLGQKKDFGTFISHFVRISFGRNLGI